MTAENPYRKIIHIDMDAFYASVEQRDNPKLRDKPVVVGGDYPRGVVAAASYEARRFGIHSAMASITAKKKCPELIFIAPRFDVYKSVSKQILEILTEYTILVEPLSLDEAFMDVTKDKKNIGSATLIAKEIKKRILDKIGITASAGISINKFLAKIASDYDKPDGLYLIKPEDSESFIEKLPVEKFFGVGKVTSMKMHKMGILTGLDLKKFSRRDLIDQFGKAGSYYYDIARGIDRREVEPEKNRKSVGAERTFETDLIHLNEILTELYNIGQILEERLRKSNFTGRTLTLKVKFENFEQITRSKSFNSSLTTELIHQTTVELASVIDYANRGVRLLGLSVSNSVEKRFDQQLSIDF